MRFFEEKLYFYYISLKSGFIEFSNYNEWLNKEFLLNDNEKTLLNLQFATNNLVETYNIMNEFLYGKIEELDFNIMGKEFLR